jgi:4-amino-4-deoxy-L-arabinose transferase-like glycosyltransferase
VLIVIALSVWSIWQGQFLKAISSLPWKTGFPLFWLLVIPWYAWAEYRTPGFIEYFVIGEHIQRFLVSGWEGDLYGSAHNRPRGMIWIYWIACAFPWSFFVIKDIFFKSNKPSRVSLATPNLRPYLIGWLIAPLLLFTLAGNILPIYVMPGFSAMAILLATKHELSKRFVISGSVTLLILLLLLAFLSLGLVKPQTEQRILTPELAKFDGATIYYWKKRPFSAQFYTRGKAKLIDEDNELKSLLSSNKRFFIVLKNKRDTDVVVKLDSQCAVINSVDKKSLYQCN